MDMVKKIGDVIFNVFYYKVALMFFLIPTLLVYCVSFNYKLLFVMLGWGALICAYDFIIRRRFVHARGMLWLIAFMVCFALSVVINFRTGLNLNLSNWAYTAIALLVLYPDSFDKTKEYKWLSENAHLYGFIMRYPKSKEDKTAVIYEPWHYRYVGIENAMAIKESGLCLEEFIEQYN